MKDQNPFSPGIPIHIVVIAPFTTIILDEGDKLGATLEQINTNTYDRIKLCRTTMPVATDIEEMTEKNFAAIISYSAAFIFPTIRSATKQRIIDSTNKILLKLLLAGIRFDAVLPSDVGPGLIYPTGYFSACGGSSGPNYRFLMALQSQAASSLDTIQLMAPRTYDKHTIVNAIKTGEEILKRLPEINASMFLEGLTHYSLFQLPSALIFLWSVVEAATDKIWDQKIVPNGQNVPGRSRFVKSNAWQPAYQIEVIFQACLIGDKLYGKLNQARAARNELIHKGMTPTLKPCECALEAAFELLSMIASDYQSSTQFDPIVRQFMEAHQPIKLEGEPEYWRYSPSVPGDSQWGTNPFPRHAEIELTPLEEIRPNLLKK